MPWRTETADQGYCRSAVTRTFVTPAIEEYSVAPGVSFTAGSNVPSNTTTKRNILKPPQRVAEWPERGESVDRRTYTHVFGATYLPATRYSYKVVVCRRSGSTKQVVKRCKWTHPGRKPRSSFKVKVL